MSRISLLLLNAINNKTMDKQTAEQIGRDYEEALEECGRLPKDVWVRE